MDDWTNEDSAAAQREGWDVFAPCGTKPARIERIDYLAAFPTDAKAAQHVLDRAIEGSQLHRRAVCALDPLGLKVAA